MMKTFVIVASILCLAFSAFASGGNADFTDQMEQKFYDTVKEQGYGHTEAEVELAVGTGLLDMNNQWQRAERHLKRAVRLDPKQFLAWYDLGLIHIDSEKGMGYFREAIKANPDFPASYYWAAYYYTRQGNFKKALPVWQDYLRVANLVKAKGEDGDEKERMRMAIAVIKQIVSGRPGKELNMIHL